MVLLIVACFKASECFNYSKDDVETRKVHWLEYLGGRKHIRAYTASCSLHQTRLGFAFQKQRISIPYAIYFN